MIRDKDGTINYTKFYNLIKSSHYKESYRFKDYIKSNQGIFMFIQSYIDNNTINNISSLSSEEFYRGYFTPIKQSNESISSNESEKLDTLKLKHNLTTLNKLGVFNKIGSKYRKEVRGQYGSSEFLTLLQLSIS